MVNPLTRVWLAWEEFLFELVDARILAWLRIALGAYLVWYYVDLFPFARLYFFPPGITPPPYYRESLPWLWINYVPYTLFWRSLAYALTGLAALSLMLGFWTRLSAFLCWYAFQSWLAIPVGRNGGDVVLATLCLLTLVASLPGHAQRVLALDAPQGFRNSTGITHTSWSLRLFQIQLVLIYFTSGFHKAASWVWYRGEAMYYVFQHWVWARLDLSWLTSPLPIGLLTYGILLWEACLFPTLIWHRGTRQWVLLAGVLFHVAIAVTIRVYVFGEAMLIAYISFLDPKLVDETWSALRRYFSSAHEVSASGD